MNNVEYIAIAQSESQIRALSLEQWQLMGGKSVVYVIDLQCPPGIIYRMSREDYERECSKRGCPVILETF